MDKKHGGKGSGPEKKALPEKRKFRLIENRWLITLFVVLVLIFIFLIVWMAKFRFILDTELTVSVSPKSPSYFVTGGHDVGINFTVAIRNFAQCSSTCRLTLTDVSNGNVLYSSGQNLSHNKQTSRDLLLPVPDKGSGQVLYSFMAACKNVKTLICSTDGRERYDTSLITVNYSLTENESRIKELAKPAVESWILGIENTSLMLRQANAMLARVPRNSVESASLVSPLPGISQKLNGISAERDRIISLWNSQNYSALGIFFSEGFDRDYIASLADIRSLLGEEMQNISAVLKLANNNIAILQSVKGMGPQLAGAADDYAKELNANNLARISRMNGLANSALSGYHLLEFGKNVSLASVNGYLNSTLAGMHDIVAKKQESDANGTAIAYYSAFGAGMKAGILAGMGWAGNMGTANQSNPINLSQAACRIAQDSILKISALDNQSKSLMNNSFSWSANSTLFGDYLDTASLMIYNGSLYAARDYILSKQGSASPAETAADAIALQLLDERIALFNSTASGSSGVGGIASGNGSKGISGSDYSIYAKEIAGNETIVFAVGSPHGNNMSNASNATMTENATGSDILKLALFGDSGAGNGIAANPAPGSLDALKSLNNLNGLNDYYAANCRNDSFAAHATGSGNASFESWKLDEIDLSGSAFAEKNLTPPEYSLDYSITLKPNPPQCCAFGQCSVCDASPPPYPVLFIHGHAMNDRNTPEATMQDFEEFQKKMQKDGYIDAGELDLATPESPDIAGEWGRGTNPVDTRASYYYITSFGVGSYKLTAQKSEHIENYALRLRDIINLLKFRTGASKVNIVAHSMGGLVTRDYLELFGYGSVNNVILVNTPNHGIDDTVYRGCLLLGASNECNDMHEGSIFLNRLNARQIPNGTKIFAIATNGCAMGNLTGDSIVSIESGYLPGAVNYRFNETCPSSVENNLHTSMIDPNIHPEAYALIMSILEGNPPQEHRVSGP